MKLRAIAAACLGLAMLTGTAFADAPSLGHGPQVYSKGQFMQLLAVETKVNPLIYSGVFKDVGSDNYYSDIVEGLVVAGIVDMEMAKDGEIGLDEPITNEEAVALMVRGLRYKKSNMAIGVDLQFEDKDDISPWALSYIEVAAANGLVDNSGRFEPQAKVMGAPCSPAAGLCALSFPCWTRPRAWSGLQCLARTTSWCLTMSLTETPLIPKTGDITILGATATTIPAGAYLKTS